jgi:hypothetical protein
VKRTALRDDAIDVFALGGQHDHGHLGVVLSLAQACEHLEAVHDPVEALRFE